MLRAQPWTPDKTFDILLTSWDVWCLASGQSQRRKSCNRAEPNDKLIPALPKRAFSVNSMAAYQVKVKYGEERFCTFLIKDITFAKLMQRNCSPLAHLPGSNIRVRYRDEDGDMISLWEDSSGFSFGEMLRSTKEVKERDYKKIFLQASEIDSPLPSKMRRTDLGMPSRKLTTSRCNRSICLFHQKPRVPRQQQANELKKVLWTSSDRKLKKMCRFWKYKLLAPKKNGRNWTVNPGTFIL